MPLSNTRKQQLNQALQTAILMDVIDLGTPASAAMDDTVTAANVYTATVPTSWAGTPPATITAALDRVAALLKTLNGGTGP